MSLDLSQIQFIGSAFPEPFVKFDLEKILNDKKILPKNTGDEGKKLQQIWTSYRRKLREIVASSGPIRVKNCLIDPLVDILGYDAIEKVDKVLTREGEEDGGFLIKSKEGNLRLRIWTTAAGTDLASPVKRGYAYRFSFVKIAQRVLFASQEKIGILTDGQELRILISDPSRTDSEVIINIDPDWKRSYHVPDAFRFLIAIISPQGIESLQEIMDKARLKQSTVTKELRVQAHRAIKGFIQGIIDDSVNKPTLNKYENKVTLAKILWHEGLIIIYRLLFILKGEASDDPARSFGFTGSTIWRNTFSPTTSLAYYIRKCIDENVNTGDFLEKGLKTIFEIFKNGVKSTELNISPLGGALFGKDSTPLLSELHWPEKSCAHLLDQLLWTMPQQRGRARTSRQRIHYGSLQISDLGNIYELLLELEPGIAEERVCRLRRSKLEVVVPYGQGEKYRHTDTGNNTEDEENGADNDEDEQENGSDGKSTKIKWVEDIKKGDFYLRTGLGKKSSGSYYTPESFVRFLVQETLGPKIDEVSPKENHHPAKILAIKVLDPAMGSGHFLVAACSFMADRLYEACRLCDEKALELEAKLEKEEDEKAKEPLKKDINLWRNRILEIPDPDDEILKYLPSSAPEAWRSGLSQAKAQALCKRLIAVHCLYGADKNPLAVELAKLSLWLETQSEGLPLTFLDHRLVLGDSITGPFFEHILKYPGTQRSLEDIFTQGVQEKLKEALKKALVEISELEKSIGIDLSDIENKKTSKRKLEDLMLPFKMLAAAWAGGVMLGEDGCDDLEYGKLAKAIAETGKLPNSIESEKLLLMICKGLGIERDNLSLQDILSRIAEGKFIPTLPYDLTFPEVFFELADRSFEKKGFDVVLGNPPWDSVRPASKEFFASLDISTLDAPTAKERDKRITELLQDENIKREFDHYQGSFEMQKRFYDIFYNYQKVNIGGDLAGRYLDLYRLFAERFYLSLSKSGMLGVVLPSAFHANEGATGIRKLYLEKMALKYCYSFENKKKIFEIHSSFKFALIIAEKDNTGTKEFNCAFYLHDMSWLFGSCDSLKYDMEFIKKTGGIYLSFAELRSGLDVQVVKGIFKTPWTLETLEETEHIVFRTEPIAFNVTSDRARFSRMPSMLLSGSDPRSPKGRDLLLKDGYFVLHEGKYFYQYTDLWSERPRYVIHVTNLTDCLNVLANAKYFRLVFRTIASSTNERTAIFTILPPSYIVSNSVAIEFTPDKRSNGIALAICGILNSFIFDFTVRIKGGANMNLFIMRAGAIPKYERLKPFLSHNCLRLVCNHDGFNGFWHEQHGDNWREPNKKPFAWPVLKADEERWAVRSAIDAVVADAYGLNREQYEHVLKSFDRASGPNPYTGICLGKFDELKKIGLEKFTKKYDPYWDMPLNEELPKPVIDLPIPEEETEKDLFGNVIKVSKKRGRRR